MCLPYVNAVTFLRYTMWDVHWVDEWASVYIGLMVKDQQHDDLKLQHFSFETPPSHLCDLSNHVTLIICMSVRRKEIK
jgi:hypothetical protein